VSIEVFPSYTEAEVFADRCVHAVGVTTGFIAAITLVLIALEHLPTGAAAAVVIYALGMLAMFCFSAAYNLSRGPKRWLWRRCDHAAIFIKIAATYTPFAVAKMGGTTGMALLAAVWGIALAGAAAKLIAPHRVARLSTLWYLAQGWTCALTMRPLLSALSPTAFVLLLAGGVLYTVGVAIHLSERVTYHNAIWHGFVLVASACHFAAVMDAVVLG
jgi:hemolysin III